MSDRAAASTARFACQSCGKSYKWKPELADRKVKCSCGHVMRAPPEPPAAVEVDDDLIPLADEQTETVRPRATPTVPITDHDHTVHGDQIMAATAMGAPAIPHDPPPPRAKPPVRASKGVVVPGKTKPAPSGKRTLAYAGPGAPASASAAKKDLENDLGGSVRGQLVVPAILVLVGFAAQLLLKSYMLTRPGGAGASLAVIMVVVSVELAIRAALTTAAVFLAAKLFDVGFGGLAPTILKIVAIALLSGIPIELISNFARFGGIYGIAFSGLIFYATSAILFKLLFDMDFEDASYCGIAATLVNFVAGFALTMLMMSML